MAIEGGCKWVVLDMPGAEDSQIREVAADLVPLCRETATILTLVDRVELAKELGVHGVLLTPAAGVSARIAREACGPEAIIGVQVEVASSALAVVGADVDYVVFPATVPLERVGENIEALRNAKFELPVVAAFESMPDIDLALRLGVNGIALGSVIADSADPVAETERFIGLLK